MKETVDESTEENTEESTEKSTEESTEKSTEVNTECSICLSEESITGKYCHGCDHEFCYSCISLWVLNFARCPLCNGEIYGLHSQDSSVYLTPHYNSFGMDIKKNGDHTEIEKILKNGIAEQYDLNVGNFIMINNKSSYSECSAQMTNAINKKKMIKVNKILPPIKEHKISKSCFDFIFRSRISPY
jgi:hypothetical protein